MLGYFTGDIGGIDLGIDLYGTAVSDLHSVSVGFNHLNTRKARARASCIFRGHFRKREHLSGQRARLCAY